MKAILLFSSTLLAVVAAAAATSFLGNVKIVWGGGKTKIFPGGSALQLSLDRSSGSGFKSTHEYLFGRIDMQIKVVPGNSAGTVTAYYLTSLGSRHDEIDFEFLGNLSSDPYTLHTNVYSNGKGDREQQFKLWFDPRLKFHTYTIVWNPKNIIWLVDNTPIRVFHNLEHRGVPYPKSQPMRLHSSLWDGDEWATRGGLVKTDWSKAPFIATYKGFNVKACVAKSGRATSCTKGPWWTMTLGSAGTAKLRAVRKYNMIYNYCTDAKRFPQGYPPECSVPV